MGEQERIVLWTIDAHVTARLIPVRLIFNAECIRWELEPPGPERRYGSAEVKGRGEEKLASKAAVPRGLVGHADRSPHHPRPLLR